MAVRINMPSDGGVLSYLTAQLIKEVSTNQGKDKQKLYCITKDEDGGLRIPMMLFRKLWPNLPMPSYLELPRRQILCNIKLAPKGKEFQIPTYENAVSSLLTTRGCYISLMCGGGKTKIATKITSDFGLVTAILVDATLIFPQWVNVFRNDTNARVAEINTPVEVLPDADVYVIMITAASKMKPEVLSRIKFLVIDEALYFLTFNRVPAILNFSPMYILGLCAEIKRDDKMECLLPHLFGNTMIRKINDHPFTVYKMNTVYKPVVRQQKYKGSPDWNEVMRSIAECEDRNMDIVDLCRSLPDSKIIVGTKRKEQANFIYDKLTALGEACSLLIENARKIVPCRILVGIYSKMGKGVDVINLCPEWEGDVFDVAILAIDMCKPEQFVGRVFRHTNPIIYDFVDDNSMLRKHFDQDRNPWYVSRNGTVINVAVPPRKGYVVPEVTEDIGKKKVAVYKRNTKNKK